MVGHAITLVLRCHEGMLASLVSPRRNLLDVSSRSLGAADQTMTLCK